MLISRSRSRFWTIVAIDPVYVATHRVRTGYGILEKLWNFEKEIPYMEKLWNLSKMAVPMEKLWNFRLGGKKVRAFLKKMGKKYVRTSMFVASVITSLGLALQTSQAIVLASAE